MLMTLGEALFKIRDHQLNIPKRWFTGEEWKDGTAEKIMREDYKRAVLEFDPPIELVEEDKQLKLL
jgi:hypothetical protein